MRDDIFDEYLSSILNDKPAEKNPEEGSALMTEEPEKQLEADSAEDIADFAEKTIRLSEGETKKLAGSLPSEPKPTKIIHRKIIRKANYSAYGGIVMATLVLCSSIVISLFIIVVGRDFLGIDTNNNVTTLYVPTGSTLADISHLLADSGIIEYPEVFEKFARLRIGSDGVIYPGDISVMPSMSYDDIIEMLTVSREAHATVTVTIIEGMTIDGRRRALKTTAYALRATSFSSSITTSSALISRPM